MQHFLHQFILPFLKKQIYTHFMQMYFRFFFIEEIITHKYFYFAEIKIKKECTENDD